MHRKPNNNNKKPQFFSLLSLSKPLLFISIMLSFIVLTLFFHLLRLNPTSSSIQTIQQACQSSLFPPFCISSLSQSQSQPQSSSPTDLILAALSLSSHNLEIAQSLSQSILDSTSQSNPARKNAAQNCLDHLSLSSHRLSAAINGTNFNNYCRALVSAALLYQYDCWSALKYVNSTHQVASAMAFVANLTRLTSNALSMIAALQRYGEDLSAWAPPQTERDGYWADSGGGNDDDDVNVQFPSDLPADVTVCKSGGGCDYTTLQEAVNAAPDYGSRRFVIRIEAGVYEETVRVPFEKTNVVFLGVGMGRTVITGKLNAQMTGVTTYNTATVGVAGDGFMARDLTIENEAGPGAHQAVAFRSDSDRSVLHSVEFLGHQDTLYARSLRQFYDSCRISGTVDFIFGNSASVFHNCSIVVVPRLEGPEKGESNAVTAHGRTDPGQATGFVFSGCIVSGSDEYVEVYRKRPGRHKVYLGRPWKEYSRTVFLNCYLGEMVRPEGWMPWRGEFALKTLFYGEFGSSGPGANESGRVEWSSRIPAEHLAVYSARNFIQGEEWLTSGQ